MLEAESRADEAEDKVRINYYRVFASSLVRSSGGISYYRLSSGENRNVVKRRDTVAQAMAARLGLN